MKLRSLFYTGAAPLAMSGAALVAALLAAASAQAADHRGGTLHAVAVSSSGTLDPQINYTTQYWQLYQSVYDGLLAFKKTDGTAGTEIVPDLVTTLPVVSDGGKTLTVTLRKGITFANGKELTTADVVASFQRIFKISGPTAGSFYNVLVGADACLKTPDTCTLDGGVVADEATGTITFHLTDADPEFLDKLAIPHAAILPADTPAKDMGNTPIPGTGAYSFTAYDPNKALKLERNPHFKQWSADAQPDGYPDVIDYTFGLTDEAGVTAIENGQADWMYDPPPADRLGELSSKYPKQLHVSPLAAYYYISFNVNMEPFNNEKARLAVNYAIDRNALVKIYGGPQTAAPTCQNLPPNFPGYSAYCPFTKEGSTKYAGANMAKAKELMKESGKAGAEVALLTEDNTMWKNMGGYVQSVLTELGFKVSLKPMSHATEFTYIQNTNNKVQVSLTDWFQDYPAPSDFLNVLFGCSSFHPASDASPNIAGFCDKEVEAKIQNALTVAVTDPVKANTLWADVDKAIVDKAPSAPLFNPKQIDFVSTKVGNYHFQPVFQSMLTQEWVK
ncbi:MAG: ABC transporter substrate-binding protein [Azospirillaceae bacterium]|nr:ABC transporter substrate-binding protein [Azospirillaceae bacterium]